jgi:hypothetical protein
MNNYLKIFLTAVLLIASVSLLSLGYYFLRMADTVFNIGGVLLVIATSLGAYWCLHQFWVKGIPKDAMLFGSKRAGGGRPEERKEEIK